jgi:hypothetical protein
VKNQKTQQTDLKNIPGVGVKIEKLFRDIGVTSTADIKKRGPEAMYRQLCEAKASPVDRCVLYVFRCAKYYVSTKKHDPEKLKWWNWKD